MLENFRDMWALLNEMENRVDTTEESLDELVKEIKYQAATENTITKIVADKLIQMIADIEYNLKHSEF